MPGQKFGLFQDGAGAGQSPLAPKRPGDPWGVLGEDVSPSRSTPAFNCFIKNLGVTFKKRLGARL
ncbi:MAG: hypothetical protein DMG23_02690 [Acidobacteria bacterium]|nr:MAG: hypothetical protein DMG23_02690 [Acidobacteriota bacterium]